MKKEDGTDIITKTGIMVRKELGEETLRTLRTRNLLDRDLAIKVMEDFLIIPLTRDITREELDELKVKGEVVLENFKNVYKKPSLLEMLKEVLNEEDLKLIPRSFDVIGDVCIVQLPEELRDHHKTIGEIFLKSMKNVRIVLNKSEPLSGDYRVGKYEILAGEGGTETIHREHGCIFRLDIAKVFFTPRLSGERARVTSLIGPGEIVCDLFAGIGPFGILIAKKNPRTMVYACDINPDAYRYMVENIRLNKVEDKVLAYLGDARALSRGVLRGIGDRVIMNLPMSSEMYIDTAVSVLKDSGGIVHLHIFVGKDISVKDRYTSIEKSFRDLDCRTKLLYSRSIREVAPFKYHWAFDIEVHKV